MTHSSTGNAGPVDGEAPLFREVTGRFGVLRLVTTVDRDGLAVRLGPLQRSPRRLPADEIRTVRVTAYDASTYAGWHWGVRRTPGGNTVYRLRGGRGVEVVRTDGRRWFVGSRRPAELASAVERVTTGD
ncbi:MAG: hypothetical protein V5A28_15470 [Haloarculaceae archaeon]